MIKRKTIKIFFIILLFLIGFMVQVISLVVASKVDVNAYAIIAISSALPFSAMAFTLSTFFDKKYKVIKYIIVFYASMLLVVFTIVCIVAMTVGFTMVDGNLVV